MPDLKFEVIFAAIDRLSGTVKSVGRAFTEMNAHIKETGENLLKAGAAMGGIGAAGLLGLKYVVEPAIEAQGEMAHLATAMQDGADQAKHLAEVEEITNAAAQKGVITTENLREAYYLARSNGLDHAKALEAVAAAADLVTGTTDNAAQANEAMAVTTRTLTGLSNIYGENLHKVADSLSLLQSKYGFKDINEVVEALHFVAPVAQGAHVGINQMSAALAILSENMITSGQAGSSLRNVLIQLLKGGTKERLVPFRKEDVHGNFLFQQSLESLLGYLQKFGPTAQSAFLIQAGFSARTITAIQVLLKNHQKLIDIQNDQDKSAGAAAKNAHTRQAAADEQIVETINSWNVLRETIGKTLVVSFGGWVSKLHEIILNVTEWVKKNPELVKQIGTWVAIGSAALIVLGVLTALAGSFLILAAFIASIGIGTVIFGAIAAVLATVAIAAYEVYKYWGPIKAFFANLWSDIKDYAAIAWAEVEQLAVSAWDHVKDFGLSIARDFMRALNAIWTEIKKWFVDIGRAFTEIGKEWLKLLGQGLLDGILYLTGPLGTVAKYIINHFKGHSPPPLGPLHELNRVNIVQTIAETIKPAPITRAITQTAAATMIAAPWFLTSGLSGGAFYGDQLRHLGSRSGRGIVVHLDYHPTFNGATPDDFSPQNHADSIVRLIKDKLYREERLRFDSGL